MLRWQLTYGTDGGAGCGGGGFIDSDATDVPALELMPFGNYSLATG